MKKIELLSPAGDMDSLIAAVRTGADAVYLGIGGFNARRNAHNFTTQDFDDAARYLRVRGVKAYLALNTLVRDDEMNAALDIAISAARSGADGFIVQDIGLAAALKQILPDIPLHASTQMAASSPEALPYLKELGFERVVTARELSREQLKQMCVEGKKHNIEIEHFVHGALCVCLSGQCYLSAAIGGRSANRGMCAGSCRLPFGINSPKEYALSLKDLSLVDYIDEMLQMGVASLKIEGRMKDAEYVAAATAVCRAAIDGTTPDNLLKQQLSDIFSRSGFTHKYYSGIGDTMKGVRTAADTKASKYAKAGIHALYRTERASVALSGSFTVKKDMPVTLTLCDGKNTVTAQGDVPQKAINKPLDESFAAAKLSKTGQTPFVINNIECDMENGLTLSASALGDVRRTALQKMEQARAQMREVKVNALAPLKSAQEQTTKQKIVLRLEHSNMLPDSINVDAVIIPAGEQYDFSGEVIAEIPRRLIDGQEIVRRLEISAKQGITYAVCNNIRSVQIAKDMGFSVIYGWFMNVFNSRSLAAAEQNGASGAMLSFELTLEQAKAVKGNIPRGIIAYGRLPLMLNTTCAKDGNFNGCAQKGCNMTLTDRTGARFPVLCADGARELLNSCPLYMADRKCEIKDFDFLVLYCTNEDKDAVRKTVNDFLAGATPPAEFTRGLYYRGVK